MRNKRLLAISAIAISASVFMTACSFGGDGKTDKTETVEVTDTPTPEVTQAPTETPVPTIAPNVQSTTYTSADKSIAINLPDATWANKTDETDMLSFESPEQGNILILHGQGEDTMAATVVPSTQDMAVSLEQADGDKVNGTDFEIQEYSANDVNGIGVYSYTTKMLNTDKSNGNLYVVHKVFANDTEYYTIDAGVKTEDALASVKAAVESFQILGDSTLKEAAPQQAPIENTAQTDANTSMQQLSRQQMQIPVMQQQMVLRTQQQQMERQMQQQQMERQMQQQQTTVIAPEQQQIPVDSQRNS